MVEIIIPYKYIDPTNSSFFNDEIYDWSVLMLNLAYPRQSIGERVHITSPNISIDNFHQTLALDNGDVKNWAAWMKIAETDIDNEIPEGLPNRDDGQGGIHTWRTWRDAGHPLPDPIEDPADGLMYYYTITFTFGKTLTSSELLIIDNSADAELIDYEEIPFPVDLSGNTSNTVII